MGMNGYWKKTYFNDIAPDLYEFKGWTALQYKGKGKWEEVNNEVIAEAGWEDDYWKITSEEAKKLMKEIDGNTKKTKNKK